MVLRLLNQAFFVLQDVAAFVKWDGNNIILLSVQNTSEE